MDHVAYRVVMYADSLHKMSSIASLETLAFFYSLQQNETFKYFYKKPLLDLLEKSFNIECRQRIKNKEI